MERATPDVPYFEIGTDNAPTLRVQFPVGRTS